MASVGTSTPLDAVDAAIKEVTEARTRVSKVTTPQIRGVDQVASLRSTAHAWFKSHRPVVVGVLPAQCAAIDAPYQTVLDSADRHASKSTYMTALKEVKEALVSARGLLLTAPSATSAKSADEAPDFSSLAGNPEMRGILTRRWHECVKCVGADAHLAAIVMMGGLLEALFVARANKLADKSELIGALASPKDKATGKTLNYQEWMLDSYIKVGFELGWITESAKDVADVLKEYRNYIHPEKERRHGVVLALNDSAMFWEVSKALTRQLLLCSSRP